MKIKLRLSKVGIKIIKGTCLLLGVFFIGLGFYICCVLRIEGGEFFILLAFIHVFLYLFWVLSLFLFIMWESCYWRGNN